MVGKQVAPLFSVIIATRNRPSFLSEAVDSVLQQRCTDWELIIVDDASTPSISRPCPFDDRRILLLHNDVSIGPGESRLRAVGRATGRYLCFLDDDDLLLPNHLWNLNLAIGTQTSPAVIFCTGMRVEHSDHSQSIQDTHSKARNFFQAFWRSPFNLLPFAIPRHIFLDRINHAYDAIEDFAWLCILISECPVVHTPEVSVIYRQHQQSRTNRHLDWPAVKQRRAVIKHLARHPKLANQLTSSDVNFQLCHQSLHWSRQCFRNRQFGKGMAGTVLGLVNLTSENLYELGYTGVVLLRSASKALFNR